MTTVKTILAMLGFVILYCFIDWFAGVTAPVLGPIVLVGMIVFLFWLIARIYKAGK